MIGLYIQPFAELKEGENPVPKVEVNDIIYRCRRCSGYLNSKFNITYNKLNKRIAICNLCNCENELDPSKPGVKSEYFNTNISDVPELSSPTIDYYAPANLKHANEFKPHYMFMIDISYISKQMGFSAYVSHNLKKGVDS